MKVLLQRVSRASVTCEGQVVGKIGPGLLLLVGFGDGDSEEDLVELANKVVNLRVFSDERGRFNYSLLEVDGELLAVSQFTLYADTSRGRRPGFSQAMEPESAKKMFEAFIDLLEKQINKPVQAGVFGAMMDVELINNGPVTILLE